MRISISVFIIPSIAWRCSGFLFAPQPIATVHQGRLIQAIDSQTTTAPLNIKLDVGIDQGARMNISGMLLELSSQLAVNQNDNDTTDKNKNPGHPKMPGADGPQPQLSTGVRILNVIQFGSFVSMKGQQQVQTLNGCWEMVWRQNALAGSLICGFQVPEDYTRNDASLPKGNIYLSFPIWNKAGLAEAQAIKESTLLRAKQLLTEKDQQLEKMSATPNPLMKALHFRNAAAAMERYEMQDLKRIEIVPSNDEVIPLHDDDLLLTTKGLVFSKEGSFHQGRHVLLGTAFASRGLMAGLKST
jgi:hypothetical protein